ncbi:MAG: histone deacetylase family protein [Bacillota bacterium]
MEKVKDTIGIVYDPEYLVHTQGQHPERKERLEHIIAALEQGGVADYIKMFDPEPAGIEDIALVHDTDYIRSIEEACLSGKRFLDMDTYIVPESYRIALLSAGGVLTGLKKIMNGTILKIFALNRPPGHHAEKNRAMGFCLFNNIAIAASAARRDFGLKKIAIVDWDVHHGNGTQHAFENDREVLFISTHQSPAYPGTGRLQEVGYGDGEGFSVNIPLPAGCGDVEYAFFFDQVIIPVLDQYKPELILISSGHDAYRQDPLAGMSLTHGGFYYMAKVLADAADRWTGGKILLCLEGGYHLQGQAGAVMQVLNAMGRWGLPITERAPDLEPGKLAQQRLREVLEVQRVYWNI